jgi:predicted RNA-binding protein with PUA-like domain
MAKRYWLMKTEPEAYSWDDLVSEGEGLWDGVRNHRAKNNLQAMKVGDQAFFYHSVTGKEIVGIMEVSVAGLKDPSDTTGTWASVKVKPVRKLERPVTLAEVKADPTLTDMELVKYSRLSVAEIFPDEWKHVLSLSKKPSGT